MEFFEFFEKSHFLNVIVLKLFFCVFPKNVKVAEKSLKIDQL
jgi:hypothetical protein